MCDTEGPMVHQDLKLPGTELPGYCRRNGIRRLELFGSATRADFGPQSEVDLLVEFRPEARIGFLALSRMQRELSVLFGRSVDLVPRAGLKAVIASSVICSAGSRATLCGVTICIYRMSLKRPIPSCGSWRHRHGV